MENETTIICTVIMDDKNKRNGRNDAFIRLEKRIEHGRESYAVYGCCNGAYCIETLQEAMDILREKIYIYR